MIFGRNTEPRLKPVMITRMIPFGQLF
jgi:hypothetical protein